jgi:hypothetical protein
MFNTRSRTNPPPPPPRKRGLRGAPSLGRRPCEPSPQPLELLREKMEAEPEPVAEIGWTAMKEGRDVRAITAMLDRTYGEQSGHVEEPHTFDQLANLSSEQPYAATPA